MKDEDFERQSEAADTILDRGVSIPMPAPWLLRALGKKRIRITIKCPYWGTLARISKVWLSMHVSAESVKNNTVEDDLKLIRQHGKKVATIVALGIWRGYISGKFAPILARYLLWRVPKIFLVEAAYKLVTLSSAKDFTNTIRLTEQLNVMNSLSPQEKGS